MKTISKEFLDGYSAAVHGDFSTALYHYTQGHQNGDDECTAMLASLYVTGEGVARDFPMFFDLAQHLQQKGSPLADCLLAPAYADGIGCTANQELALKHLEKWSIVSESSIPGVSDLCRIILRMSSISPSLCSIIETIAENENSKPMIDIKEANLEYSKITPFPDAEFIRYVDNPSSYSNDEAEKLLKSAYDNKINHSPLLYAIHKTNTIENPNTKQLEEINRLLLQKDFNTSNFAKDWLTTSLVEDIELEDETFDRLWMTVQYGSSGIPRQNDLPGLMSLKASIICGHLFIHSQEKTQELLQNKDYDKLAKTTPLPEFLFVNQSGSTLDNLTLRIVLEGVGVEQSFPLQETVANEELLSIDLNLYTLYHSNNIRVEIITPDGRYAQAILDKLLLDDICVTMPPLIAFKNEKENQLCLALDVQDTTPITIMDLDENIICETELDPEINATAVPLTKILKAIKKSSKNAFLISIEDAPPILAHLV